jgi:hypothetical protein
VFITARCWSSPDAKAPLNDGQNIHKNIVPIKKTKEKTGF